MLAEKIQPKLIEMGLLAKPDNDGDLSFRYNARQFYAVFDDEDPHYMMLILPRQFSIDSELEMQQSLQACNDANKNIKAAKAYIDDNAVSISSEIILNDPSKITEKTIIRYLDVILDARNFIHLKTQRNELGK